MTRIGAEETHKTPENGADQQTVHVKKPKRILHFSDGTLEEYSDDEVDNEPKPVQTVVDPATLTWGPWFWYKAWTAGSSTLSAIDYVGGFFASLFGITTPKYYFEIEEFKKRQAELKEEKEQEQSWATNQEEVQLNNVTMVQPQPSNV